MYLKDDSLRSSLLFVVHHDGFHAHIARPTSDGNLFGRHFDKQYVFDVTGTRRVSTCSYALGAANLACVQRPLMSSPMIFVNISWEFPAIVRTFDVEEA